MELPKCFKVDSLAAQKQRKEEDNKKKNSMHGITEASSNSKFLAQDERMKVAAIQPRGNSEMVPEVCIYTIHGRKQQIAWEAKPANSVVGKRKRQGGGRGALEMRGGFLFLSRVKDCQNDSLKMTVFR